MPSCQALEINKLAGSTFRFLTSSYKYRLFSRKMSVASMSNHFLEGTSSENGFHWAKWWTDTTTSSISTSSSRSAKKSFSIDSHTRKEPKNRDKPRNVTNSIHIRPQALVAIMLRLPLRLILIKCPCLYLVSPWLLFGVVLHSGESWWLIIEIQ